MQQGDPQQAGITVHTGNSYNDGTVYDKHCVCACLPAEFNFITIADIKF